MNGPLLQDGDHLLIFFFWHVWALQKFRAKSFKLSSVVYTYTFDWDVTAVQYADDPTQAAHFVKRPVKKHT